jgi:magnesium transporter
MKNTAQDIVIKEFPQVFEYQTIAEVEQIVIKNINLYKTFNYVYVTDDWDKLVGIASIKDIFRHSKDVHISEISIKKPIVVAPEVTEAKVAYLALKNALKEVPVVDAEGKLVGIIPNDVILSVAFRESRDDLMRFAGYKNVLSLPDNILEISVFTALKHRLPWLILGLVGGILAAKIIDGFEMTLQKNLILASFIPLIVYMSDAVGTQMEAFIIRDLALNADLNFKKYLFKQLSVLFFIGILSSVVVFGATNFIYGDIAVSYTLAIALFVAILSSVVTGLLIPYIFSRIKTDPANASGPIATIIQDIFSVLIYFTVAYYLIA